MKIVIEIPDESGPEARKCIRWMESHGYSADGVVVIIAPGSGTTKPGEWRLATRAYSLAVVPRRELREAGMASSYDQFYEGEPAPVPEGVRAEQDDE